MVVCLLSVIRSIHDSHWSRDYGEGIGIRVFFWKFEVFVTPIFPKKTQVQTYMHARIKFHAYSWHKWITETISRKKKGDYQRFTLNPGNEGAKLHKQSTGGYVRLEPATSSQRLQSSFLLLSNIVYSKGEHLSYSASVGEKNECKGFIVDWAISI
jgi:hypothetical protein